MWWCHFSIELISLALCNRMVQSGGQRHLVNNDVIYFNRFVFFQIHCCNYEMVNKPESLSLFSSGWGHFHSKNLVTATLGWVRLGWNNKEHF